MMTDPIADMLTRIRNATASSARRWTCRRTKLKERIAQVLKDEGFILDFQVGKYAKDDEGQTVFQTPVDAAGAQEGAARVPEVRPGRRAGHSPHRAGQPAGPAAVSAATRNCRPVLDGLGIAILSTSHGVMSDRQARAKKLGGELLCTVW